MCHLWSCRSEFGLYLIHLRFSTVMTLALFAFVLSLCHFSPFYCSTTQVIEFFVISFLKFSKSFNLLRDPSIIALNMWQKPVFFRDVISLDRFFCIGSIVHSVHLVESTAVIKVLWAVTWDCCLYQWRISSFPTNINEHFKERYEAYADSRSKFNF